MSMDTVLVGSTSLPGVTEAQKVEEKKKSIGWWWGLRGRRKSMETMPSVRMGCVCVKQGGGLV